MPRELFSPYAQLADGVTASREWRALTSGDSATEAKQREYEALLHHSPDATVVVGAEGEILHWNPAAEVLLGLPREKVVGLQVRDLMPAASRGEFDAAWAGLTSGELKFPVLSYALHRSADTISVRAHTASIEASGGRFAGAVAILRGHPVDDEAGGMIGTAVEGRYPPPGNPSDVHAPAAEALGVLERDELTGLSARRRLLARLADPVPPSLGRGVAVLDVDAFALVDEAYGRDVADEVLHQLGRRLAAWTREAELGRWDVDAFVWVVDTTHPTQTLTELSRSVVAGLQEPFEVGADRVHLRASMGVATTAVTPASDLLSAAMQALRAAKDSGRDRVEWYSDALRDRPPGSFRLGADLRHGIDHGELRLHFQPIMDLARGEVVGVEALVRWERPGVGLLSPASFIDVAERTGQIVPLGAWVARSACQAAVDLHARNGGTLVVSINVSARQLNDAGLVEMLRDALKGADCPPSALVVEITETALLDDLESVALVLDEIKSMGVGLDLDDFGTGYSSLLHLKHFPVDRVKIDRAFVAGLGSDHADTVIVASTIALAHSIGTQAVAEGVETVEQLEWLRQLGCDQVQGYLISRPLDRERLDAWLASLDGASIRIVGESGHGEAVHPSRDPGSREAQADRRDAVADGRDVVADLREELANVRDGVAADRDTAADHRETTGSKSPAAADDRTKAARGREAATRDRQREAEQRLRAEQDREVAEAQRGRAAPVTPNRRAAEGST